MKSFAMASTATLVLLTLTISIGMAFTVVQETTNSTATNSTQAEKPAAEDDFVPVDNMHHFMEYICEPSYKGLKQVLATEPADRAAWKVFKNHALVLAETSTLVATRAPDDENEAKQWRQISLDVHKSGTALYKSSGNYEEANQHYGLMIDQCNHCHTVFAEGKHQLEK